MMIFAKMSIFEDDHYTNMITLSPLYIEDHHKKVLGNVCKSTATDLVEDDQIGTAGSSDVRGDSAVEKLTLRKPASSTLSTS
jgi:hypothetical protein